MSQIGGDMEVMPVEDIVAWLANRKYSGKLTFTRGNVERSFVIDRGMVTQGVSNDPREYLGQHLINFGCIDEDQLEKAFRTQKETQIPLGRILIMVGEINEELLNRALCYKVRESLLDTLEWLTGKFTFTKGESGKADLDLAIPVSLGEVHSEGMSRRSMWLEIRKTFTSGSLRCDVISRPPKCSASDAQILDLLVNGLTISDLVLEMRTLEFHVCARLYDLFQRGHIRPQKATGKPNHPPSGDSMHAAMRDALSKHDYDQAYTSAQKMLDSDANDAEALAAIRTVQEHMKKDVETHDIDRGMVPVLKINRKQATSGEFTAKERYVLSRVDGERTLNQIIQVSPISEVEFIRIVERFRDQDMIDLK